MLVNAGIMCPTLERIRMREALQEYLSAREAGEITKIVSLFEPDGQVSSPFRGRMTARRFFPKVAKASSGSEHTVHDILISSEGQRERLDTLSTIGG